jgi:hypothetical protein
MYDSLETRPSNRKIQITIDPFLLSILILFFVLTLVCLGYLIPFFQSFNHLVQILIPNEIEFYHQIIAQQNQTISNIEQNIFTPILLQKIQTIVIELQDITSELNITQIQTNINDIANTLNQIIHHI